ncbi:Ger(x)C family spore germination protein [Ornithinibacillus scapharcae]|uniref:Ger(x)C family spore germination protein n=1 Tax=Ornithinibacillus scapharcae TaxID=1147159 RepID=UPI000225AA64|nr:Ger(x)C family spore germination protein [Ornithinibacillus scapharcae]
MKLLRISILLCSLLLLTSCIETLQLEDLGIILSRGVDSTEDQELEITMAILQFMKDAPSTTKTVSGSGKTLKAAVQDANKSVSQEIVPGKIDLEIYGRDLAEQGLNPILDTLRRDADIPNTLLLAVADSKASELFTVEEESINTNLGEFLRGLIQPGTEEQLFPEVPLPGFSTTIRNEGIDPILPILGLRDGLPALVGIALFKDDKMVGELPLEYEGYFKMMEGTLRNYFLNLTVPIKALEPYLVDMKHAEQFDHIDMSLVVEKGKSKIKLKNKEKLQYDTNVNIKLNLQEINVPLKLDLPEAVSKLENEIEKKIKENYENILSHLKEVNSDAFGYGITYRIQNKDGKLTDEEWDAKFPQIEVKYDVKARIVQQGEVHR